MSDIPFGFTVESWKLIISIAGSVLASVLAFLGYTLARNESTWQNRQREWEDRSKFYQEDNTRLEKFATSERNERLEKETQLDKLREKVAELRDQKSEILKRNLLETEAAVLKLKSDLSNEVERLKKEVELKDTELNNLRSSQTQSLRELETLRAEVSVRNRFIDELQAEIDSLTVISEANNEIAIRLDRAALDIQSVGRTRNRVFSQLSNMRTDVILTTEKAVIAAKNIQSGRAEQRMKSEMERRNQREATAENARSFKLQKSINDPTKER